MGTTTPGRTEIALLRRYLLGQLTREEEEQVELRLLTDASYVEELDMMVDEITDQYVRGELQDSEREQAEKYFFKSVERQDKLSFAEALDRHRIVPRPQPWWKRKENLALAASVVVAFGLGFGVWRAFLYQSDVDKGLIALNSAYRDQRPIEARLSGLNYAPVVNQRGGSSKVDYVQHDLASSVLRRAVSANPSADSHRALGLYFLADHQFDQAIENLNAALKLDPNNAKIHSDLGAAWLEKGKIDRSGPEPTRGTEDLSRSLENFNKALALNPNLPEALFNRALYYEYVMQPSKASEDLHRYLGLDTGSAWAAEANQRIKTLDKNTSPKSN